MFSDVLGVIWNKNLRPVRIYDPDEVPPKGDPILTQQREQQRQTGGVFDLCDLRVTNMLPTSTTLSATGVR